MDSSQSAEYCDTCWIRANLAPVLHFVRTQVYFFGRWLLKRFLVPKPAMTELMSTNSRTRICTFIPTADNGCRSDKNCNPVSERLLNSQFCLGPIFSYILLPSEDEMPIGGWFIVVFL